MHNQIKIYHKLVSKSYFWPVSSVWLKSESWDLSDSVSEMSVTSTSEVAVASGMVKINCSILTEVNNNKKRKKKFSLSQPHSKNKLSSDILLWSLLSKSIYGKNFWCDLWNCWKLFKRKLHFLVHLYQVWVRVGEKEKHLRGERKKKNPERGGHEQKRIFLHHVSTFVSRQPFRCDRDAG